MAKTGAAIALCALLVAAPFPAAARVTITVEVAYGGVIAGGIGIFLYIGGSWDVPFAVREMPTSLIEISHGRARLGVPQPSLRPDADAESTQAPEVVQLDLFRWRF